ncbi:uncharacterized sugar kinase YeiI-like isoform X2 [Stegodyphus dumicola]|uniref:uncharacterized sugar kinase YeiI-like isoform X2 n=1 Tax=Stegodyphus dumicola TaxID=202533 RepID=UPI0015ADDC46|nr:uncharacterized sugar kinase YeiI-like isoform X2 [Stegodyphus dumicola]
MDGRTLDGKVESTTGGVARNVADCLARLKLNPFLISTAGAGEYAQLLLGKMAHMDVSGIKIIQDARTATCVIILDSKGECLFVVGDMNIHERLSLEQVDTHNEIISSAPLVIIDGNIPKKTMDHIFEICIRYRVPDVICLFNPLVHIL